MVVFLDLPESLRAPILSAILYKTQHIITFLQLLELSVVISDEMPVLTLQGRSSRCYRQLYFRLRRLCSHYRLHIVGKFSDQVLEGRPEMCNLRRSHTRASALLVKERFLKHDTDLSKIQMSLAAEILLILHILKHFRQLCNFLSRQVENHLLKHKTLKFKHFLRAYLIIIQNLPHLLVELRICSQAHLVDLDILILLFFAAALTIKKEDSHNRSKDDSDNGCICLIPKVLQCKQIEYDRNGQSENDADNHSPNGLFYFQFHNDFYYFQSSHKDRNIPHTIFQRIVNFARNNT